MNESIGDLVLAPFKDIVAQGKTAINNAEGDGNDEMLRAAQVLVKEGERALKKIEPVCQKVYDEYGPNFVMALMDNGPISELTEGLNDILYDFEDYVEADRFDASRFSELYALSRKAAPRILHIITHMKHALPRYHDMVTSPVSETSSIYEESPLPLPYPEGPEADGQIQDAMRYASEPEEAPTEAFRLLAISDQEDPPPLSVLDPWLHTFHVSKEGLTGNGSHLMANSVQDVPDGLIPVEEAIAEHDSPVEMPPPVSADCSITLSSSFYQFRGFCQGSMEIIQGAQGLSGGFTEVAKCKSCPFELEWGAVERDINKECVASENFKSAGIGFRLRFLSKSHVQAKHVGDQVYGCLFCIQLGRTTHYNDATVFFSQKQIFSHLARHTRPLPHVPGLTVVETADIGSHANNFDLHFLNPPLKSPLATIMRDLAALPTATAVQTYRSTPTSSIKRPTDGQEVANFAAGARLLGVVFPDRSDHQYAAFPIGTIKLDAPKKSDIRLQGSSNMRAVARWKFSPREKSGGWLSFNKGETITNIGWSHQEHWCWSGTNSKGKTGIFPQSHVEPGSLVEGTTRSGGPSVAGREKKTGLFSRISTRHRSSGSVGGGLSPQYSIC
ncbi:hypothetical protein diail_81 [Diaporthe ilicicola]|nr:hypothetical protein diail_81 [Diaporthe ilicicola]